MSSRDKRTLQVTLKLLLNLICTPTAPRVGLFKPSLNIQRQRNENLLKTEARPRGRTAKDKSTRQPQIIANSTLYYNFCTQKHYPVIT
jgi:hypothetical protein